MIRNVLTLNESQDGNRIKQGDLSLMRYILNDTNNDDLKIEGLPAKVYLTDKKGVKYIYDTTVKKIDNTYVCDVLINQIIPANSYSLEIWVDNKYVFPSDNKTKIEVTESVIGRQLINIENHDLWKEMIEYGIKNGLINNETRDDTFVISDKEPTDITQIWIDTTGGKK